MTDNAQSIEIEELVLTLHALIEQQQELLADSQDQGTTNDEHVQQISAMIKQLTGLLKTYQDKEQLIIDNTNQALKNNINAAFQKNQKDYHALIDQGFTTHIDTATKRLSTVAVKIEKEFDDLETAAHNSKTEFESRQGVFKLYEDTYDIQSRKLQESVDKTLTKVAKDTEDTLSDIGHDFTGALTWKMTGMLGAICLGLILITFAIAWLFIPSKADIAERRASYLELERYQVTDNVSKGTNGYYADVIYSTCFKAKDGKTWCKFR
jgi:ribosomal protein L20